MISSILVRNFFYTLFAAAILWTGWILWHPPAGAVVVEQPELILFGSDSCPHCADEKEFLKSEYGTTLRWNYLAIEDSDNLKLYNEYRQHLGLGDRSGTPFTILPAESAESVRVVIGFDAPATTGAQIRDLLAARQPGWILPEDLLATPVADIQTINAAACSETTDCETTSEFLVSIPFVGQIDFAKWALPTATITLGLVDGFNPCAMWVLVVLLTLLIATKDKSKLWLIGGIFIFVSALTYYIFIVAQSFLLQFLGLNFFVLKAIGLLAIGAGLFYLYEFLTVEAGVCTVTDANEKKKLMERMKLLIQPKVLPATLLGITGLAFSVNLIELACTAGLPVIFNGLLQFWGVTPLEQQAYILLYILMYMLDDVLVFAIAVKTLELVGFSGRFSKASNLIGGVLMVILGTLLIYDPSLLSFG